MTLSSGTKLGRYKIRSQLGAGGMGEVYLAHDAKLDRRVALKILPPEAAANRQRMQRFTQEAKTASALNHPNILTIYEIDETNSTHFIVTEFIEGETLRERMSKRSMNLSEMLDIAIQIASALSAAHAAGIIHRDIKPENIILRKDGLLKVVDFGLAKLTERQTDSVDAEAPTSFKTSQGTAMGTAFYMSPEQARGLQIDARTDVFSLGIVMYEMVSGRLPFDGSSSNEVVASILSEREIRPLTRYSAEVPAELERIVSKALRKSSAERYQTVEDLRLDLKSLSQQLDFEKKLEQSVSPKWSTAERVPARTAQTGWTTVEERGLRREKSSKRNVVIVVAAMVMTAAIAGAYLYLKRSPGETINSIAVLPFVNASGNSELEYLSDGMTDSLINSLSQLPNLAVKARSSVFRYKGKEVDPQKLAADLSVQAILSGRVVQRGDQLTLYLSLVEGRNGNQIWGEQYDRKLADLVSLQTEIARHVSHKLQTRLSGPDEQKLTRTYTANPEAYQLYLRGRYHLLKHTSHELTTAISNYRKAIEIDPSYALAYVGLAEAYRLLALPGELPATERMAQSKAAAQKALDIDDTLAEAHAALGLVHMWHDWDWNKAEGQFKRAVELNPNSADAYEAYASFLSFSGRSDGLAEIRRARELDPLNLRVNAIEGNLLVFAGQTDNALVRLQKTLELDPNYWFALVYSSSAHIEKGMFAEAIAEARRAKELSSAGNRPRAFLGYALAKSGKTAEARAELEGLLGQAKERHISSYHIAMIYNGLEEREKTLDWLERAYLEREPRMIQLKADPKWKNLRNDPRFQDLLRRVGLLP